jgi:spore germination cell wall hydrolase CwlJ-like protein
VRTTELEHAQYASYPASEEEITALAVLIHCEAANQGIEGQLAVGAVVMNRIRDPRFAQNDIMSVIRAGGQFSPVTSGRFDLVLTQALDTVAASCYEAANRAVAGESNVGDRTFFRTYRNYPSLSGLVIRDHIFAHKWNFPAE